MKYLCVALLCIWALWCVLHLISQYSQILDDYRTLECRMIPVRCRSRQSSVPLFNLFETACMSLSCMVNSFSQANCNSQVSSSTRCFWHWFPLNQLGSSQNPPNLSEITFQTGLLLQFQFHALERKFQFLLFNPKQL